MIRTVGLILMLALLGGTNAGPPVPRAVAQPVVAKAALRTPAPKAVPLEVLGDTVLVVKSLPCRIKAPAGADFYRWKYPATLTVDDLDSEELVITAGAKGSYRVTITTTTLTFDPKTGEKTTTRSSGETTLNIGDVPAPPGPPDPPIPPTPDTFTKDLAALYAAEADPLKENYVYGLGVLYRQAMKQADVAKTYGELATWIQTGRAKMCPDAAMLPFRTRIGKYLVDAGIETKPAGPLDDAGRAKAKELFAKVAAAMTATLTPGEK